MKIYLMRHGETTSDVENKYGGWYDDSLSEKGKIQSLELAKKLLDVEIEKIYSSPLKRAQQTSKIIAELINVPVEIVEGIKERNNYGILTGMNKKEAKEKYPEEVEELEAKTPYHKVKNSEDYFVFAERITNVFTKIIESAFEEKKEGIGFVTHGGPIIAFFREILGFEIRNVSDCALIELEYDGSGYEIVDRSNIEEIWSEI